MIRKVLKLVKKYSTLKTNKKTLNYTLITSIPKSELIKNLSAKTMDQIGHLHVTFSYSGSSGRTELNSA